MRIDLQLFCDAFPRLISGLDETLVLAVLSLAIGFVLAVLIALMRLSMWRPICYLAIGYVYIFRSTPLLVQMFLIYYGSGQFREALEGVGLWTIFRESWFCAVFALTLNTAAYTSEIVRGGIQSVPWGQIEAGHAIGMSGVRLLWRIVFPVAMRQALPAYGNEIMLMVKSTSLASTITILEITGIAKKIIAATDQPIEVFLVAGALYLAINFIVSRAVILLEYRLNPHLREAKSSTAVSLAPPRVR